MTVLTWIAAKLLIGVVVVAELGVLAFPFEQANARTPTTPEGDMARKRESASGPDLFGPIQTRPSASGPASAPLSFGPPVERSRMICNVSGVPCQTPAECRGRSCRQERRKR